MLKSADRHRLAPLAQAAGEMQELRAVRACEPLARKPQHEALEVTAEAQQHPLPRQVDRCDPDSLTRLHTKERVGGQPVHRLVDRRAAKAGQRLQVLDRGHAAWAQLADDEQVLQPLVGLFDHVRLAAPARRRPLRRFDLRRPSLRSPGQSVVLPTLSPRNLHSMRHL